MTPGFSISLSGISKFYPGVVALSDVRLEIAAGEVVGLIGENGAGKSTLMKVLGGTISPDRGTIEVAGEMARLRVERRERLQRRERREQDLLLGRILADFAQVGTAINLPSGRGAPGDRHYK